MSKPEGQPMQRIRITYSKGVPLRYTGTLDVHKIWERILRRAALPLAYSQGFHPQPRINQACPLPLGMTSTAEVIDIWLDCPVQLMEIAQKLTPVLPYGIDIHAVTEVALNAPALQSQVVAADYLVILMDKINDLEFRVQKFLKETSIIRQRRGRSYDLRPLVESLEVLPTQPSEFQQLTLRLSLRPGASGRPEEVLLAIGIDPSSARNQRTTLHFE